MTRTFARVLFTVPLAIFALGAAARAEPEPSPEPSDGKLAFNNGCRTCHSFKPGDNRLGPSLHGVLGRKAGTLEGYGFSSAMQQSGIVWDEATLDAFIEHPENVVHGNAMKPFGGIDDPAQRQEIIAYLKSISGK
jgi:cytochrome c